MKEFNHLPDRSDGKVGDKVRVLGRIYQKASNGKWGPVLDGKLVAQVRKLYSEDGLTLRATAQALSDEVYTFSSSVIQNIVNDHGWMRSHYGEADRKAAYLDQNRKILFKLFDEEALSIPDLGYVTGLGRAPVAAMFAKHGRSKKIGARHSEERVSDSRRMSKAMSITWNGVLTTDADSLSFQEYKKCVRRLTQLVYRLYRFINYDERHHFTHLDHNFSIHDGYWTRRNGRRIKRDKVVPFSLIAHPHNLRIISREENLEKGDDSHITLERLTRKVNASRVKLEPINRNKELRMVAAKYKLRPYEEN